jgi:hypothetical protein
MLMPLYQNVQVATVLLISQGLADKKIPSTLKMVLDMVMNTVNFIKQSFDSGVHTVLRNVDIQC